MKKILASILIATFLLIPGNSLLASGEVGFFEALGNMVKIQDHKLVQSFYGQAEFEEGEDHITAEYRVSINSVVDDGNRIDSFSRVSALIKFINHNAVSDSTPFKEMTIQASGEIITKNQQDFFFKLNNFNVGLEKALPFAVVDVENVKAMADLYRGTWYKSSANELINDSYSEKEIDLEKYIEVEDQMKEDPKGAILELAELSFNDSGDILPENEIDNILSTIKLGLETKIFTERDVVAGRNTGFQFFNLNKGAIINFMGEVAKIMDEEMTREDESIIRVALSKVSLSGIYRIENIYNIVDNLLVRFRLRDVGPLKNLELNYRYKIWGIDDENNVKAPTEYENWEADFENFGNEF